MPFSRSRSMESMTRSRTEPSSAWWAVNTPDSHSMASTSVVLPWSTWAMMATLRRSFLVGTTNQTTRGRVRRNPPLRGPDRADFVALNGSGGALRCPRGCTGRGWVALAHAVLDRGDREVLIELHGDQRPV